jgi:hypothetical protein
MQMLSVIMHSLHDVHGVNAYIADHICLSVVWLKKGNNFDEIWYGHHAIGGCPH